MYAIDPLRTASQAQTSPLTEVNKELSLAARCAQHVHVSTVWHQRWWPMQGVHTALHHKDFAPVRPFHIRKGWRPLQTKQTVCFVEQSTYMCITSYRLQNAFLKCEANISTHAMPLFLPSFKMTSPEHKLDGTSHSESHQFVIWNL